MVLLTSVNYLSKNKNMLFSWDSLMPRIQELKVTVDTFCQFLVASFNEYKRGSKKKKKSGVFLGIFDAKIPKNSVVMIYI